MIRPLPTVLALALAVRLFVALHFPNIIAPDEVFQFLEQAHRLVFGQGVVPWEYQVGLRCWLIPLALAGPMALAHWLDPDPMAGLRLIRVLLCLAALPIVHCAARWGGAAYGARGAWIAGLFAALWPDLWLMAPHPLEEVLAADALVPAVYLILAESGGTGRVVAAAMLLGLAFTLRLQLAPAVAIAGIVLCKRDLSRWRLALLAAALPVVVAGMLDWFTWGQPFRSFWLNIWLNLVLGVAKQSFGASPPGYFIGMMGIDWLWTLPVFLFLVWRGARRRTLPAVMALAILLTHSLIAHKEFRFVFPAIALVVPLAGLGLAECWTWLARRRPRLAPLLLGLALAGPLVSPFTWFMLEWQTGPFRLFQALAARRPALVSLQGWDRRFIPFDIVFSGATRLTDHTNLPGAEAGAVVAGADSAGIPNGYAVSSCVAGNWIPFATPAPRICAWVDPAVTPTAGRAPAFTFPFPLAARPFIITGRL